MDPESRRFSRRVAIQRLVGLGGLLVVASVFGGVELADGRLLQGALGLTLAATSFRMVQGTWAINRLAIRGLPEDAPVGLDAARSVAATPSATPPAEGMTTWWYWVRPRLTTTRFDVSDAEGEWVGEFDRHGHLGHRARAQDLERERYTLRLGSLGEAPEASVGRDVVARIVDDRLQVGGRWLEIDLPRDAAFDCTVHHGGELLLRVSRWPEGPFARVEFSAGLPEPSLVVLLVLFVLTCDHDLAHTYPGG